MVDRYRPGLGAYSIHGGRDPLDVLIAREDVLAHLRHTRGDRAELLLALRMAGATYRLCAKSAGVSQERARFLIWREAERLRDRIPSADMPPHVNPSPVWTPRGATRRRIHDR